MYKQRIAGYRQKGACYGLNKINGILVKVRVTQMQPKCPYNNQSAHTIKYNIPLLALARSKSDIKL